MIALLLAAAVLGVAAIRPTKTRRARETTSRDFRKLFAEFAAPSWSAWNSIEDCAFGRTPDDPELVKRVTGRSVLPTAPVSECWIVAGRGAGKSRFVARLAAFFACARTYARAPGERIYIAVFAPDRKQAGVTYKYIVGLLRSNAATERLIANETKESIELVGDVVIEVITASNAAPRGRSYAFCCIEEAAYLPSDDSADPDVELLRAVRPALARVPGSLLVVVSSPYAQRGMLYETWRQRFGRDEDADVLVVQADTRTLNSTFQQAVIDRLMQDDPVGAGSEYGATFRSDLQPLFTREALDGVTVRGRRELPPMAGIAYAGFVDPSGGSSDSFTLAIAHRQYDGVAVLDLVRERKPPFSPEGVVGEFAAVLKQYGVTSVTGDCYAGEWPREACRKHGIAYVPSELTKSAIFLEALAPLNSGTIELLDHPRLLAQLASLERRVGHSGKDAIDHPPHSHDDVANAAAGALVMCIRSVGLRASWPTDFTFCAIEGLVPWAANCCCLGGSITPDDPICHRDCVGWKAARTAYDAYTRGHTPGELVEPIAVFVHRQFTGTGNALVGRHIHARTAQILDRCWNL